MGVVSINKIPLLSELPADLCSQRVSSLFCAPEVLSDLLSACLEHAGPQVISEIILQDAPFAAQVVEVAVKLSAESLDATEPVTAAVQSLGSSMITGLALQAARRILDQDLSAAESEFLQRLWSTSRFAGQAARCIAPSINYPYIEEAQLCGLLQNLGIHLLFAQHRVEFLEESPVPWSCAGQAVLERQRFQTDHLQLAAERIESWKLDSFLGDAVRFLSADSLQLKSANPLFRIARLAQLFAGSQGELNPEAVRLGDLFFNLRQSETDYLFDWVSSLAAPSGRWNKDQQQGRDPLVFAQQRLTDQIFLVASQEAARARLTTGGTPEEIARIAGSLYLENSSAESVHFFLLDQRRQELVGLSSIGKSRLSRELKIPLLAEVSLASRALVRNMSTSTFAAGQALTVTDHLLLRLCGSKQFLCQPLYANGHPLAVAVFGFSAAENVASIQTPAVTMLHPVISSALAQVSVGELSRIGDGTNLLRRVNHEISSPLTIIANYAEVLKSTLSDNAGRELTEAIKRESRRVDEIVNYYLNQQEMFEFPDQEVDINQLVQETVDSLRESDLAPRNIVVRYRVQPDLPRLATLAILIRQIVVNLVKNAAEALADGGEITFTTREGFCADRHRYVEICIEDNGPGIPAAIRDRLFRPVVSTKGAGHSGSGLSIVKGMVEDLGGRINCHSSPETGTSFYLQIPVLDDFKNFS